MELAFTGAFAWAAWQVLGRLQRHAAKIEKNIDDGLLLGMWEEECKKMAASKKRDSAAMGAGAAASGHEHIFEDWRNKKLRPQQMIQLACDLADLAQWAGSGRHVPELRVDGPVKSWAEYGTAGKVHLLQAADALNFNFAEAARRNAEGLADNWLWQVTEALPSLSAEPLRSTAPNNALATLKTRLTEAEAAVRAVFDAERNSQAAGLKGLVEPLSVARCARNLQVLKALATEVGLNAATAAPEVAAIRAALSAPLSLEAAAPAVAAQKQAAADLVKAEADAAVAAERSARTAEIETAAAKTYRRALVLQASSPTHWHMSSDTPALQRLGLMSALLMQLACDSAAGTAEGDAAAAELADAVRKLMPQMRIKLSEDDAARRVMLLAALSPAPPPPPPAPKPEPEEGAEEGEEEQEAEKEEAPAAPARPSPAEAAQGLVALMEGVIRAQLAEAAEARKAARAAAKEAKAAAAAAAKAAQEEAQAGEGSEEAAEKAEAGEEAAAKAEAEEEAEEEDVPPAAETVDVAAVRKGVEQEARARSDSEKEAALLKLEDALSALHEATTAKSFKGLVERLSVTAPAPTPAAPAKEDEDGTVEAVEGDEDEDEDEKEQANAEATPAAPAAAPLDAGSRLLALESLLRGAAKATDAGLAAATADALAKLTDADRAALDGATTAVLSALSSHLALVKLVADTDKLDLAPGACDTLRRVDAWLAEQEVKAAAAAAEPEPEAKPAAEEGDKEDGEGEGEGEGEAAGEAKKEEAPAKPKTADPARLAEGRRLVSDLLSEGLVLLELPPASYRKLQQLRESVDKLDPVGGDGAVQHAAIKTLGEVVSQLGPIGGSVDARLSQVSDEGERAKLGEVRSAAVAIYGALTAFLRLENDTWVDAKSTMDKARTTVFGLKVERKAATLAEGVAACAGIHSTCVKLGGMSSALGSEPAKAAAGHAKAALQETAEQAHTTAAALDEYLSYVRLREHALGGAVSAPAEVEDTFELQLPQLDEMTAKHNDQAVWLDIAGMGLPAVEEEDEESAAAHEEALAGLQERLDGWHSTGLRLLARGQAALVTLGGATTEAGELRLTADIGLPSAKSLLQLCAEKIRRLQTMAADSVSGPNSGVANPLHWYLLVPAAAQKPLQDFLAANEHFGLLPSQVHVAVNDVRPPLLTEEGLRVVLDSSGTRVARSQPGTGEVFLALRRSGALAHMRKVGVRCIEVETVEDNTMARPLDPAFLGACSATAIDAAAKVAVPGVQTEGTSALPELYSRYLELLGTSSPLLVRLGDCVPAIGTYYFSLDYVKRVDKLLRDKPLALYRLAPADKLPSKAAAATGKAAAAAPGGGAAGYRLERRLSDFASPAACKLIDGVQLAMVAVDVAAEFAPVWGTAPFYKTASPTSAVDALLLQQTRWVEQAGGALEDEEEGVVEVSPLVSYAGEGLDRLVEGKVFADAYVHELQGFDATSTGAGGNSGVWAVPAVVAFAGAAALQVIKGK